MKTQKVKLIMITIAVLTWQNTLSQAPEIEWQNTIGGNYPEQLYSVQQTSDGGYILGGNSNSEISGDKEEPCLGENDYWVVKLNSVGVIDWQRTIGGNQYDFLSSVQQTSDNGYILAGYSYSGISGNKTEASLGGADYWVVKINSSGATEWQNTIGGSSYDALLSIQQTSDGGYFLGGESNSGISGDKTESSLGGFDYWVVKLSSTGDIEWQNTIGGNENDQLRSIQLTADGGYILGGSSSSDISGDKTEASGAFDYWVVKLNETGIIEWENTIIAGNSDNFHSIQQTADFGYILGGDSNSNIGSDKSEDALGGQDYWVVKLNPAGGIEWQNTIGGKKNDFLTSVQQTKDGGYLLGGHSESGKSDDKSEGNNQYDYWIVKISSKGIVEWDNTIGGDDNDYLYSTGQTSDGGFVLGGYSFSEVSGDKTEGTIGPLGNSDYWVIKLYPETCGIPVSLITGNITSLTAFLKWDDVSGVLGYKVRYKVAGTSEWTNVQSSDNDKTLHSLTPETEYAWQVKSICGIEPIVSSDWSVKQFFTTNSMKSAGEIAAATWEVYPNPFISATTIEFSIMNTSSIKIDLLDLQGRKIKTITEGNFEAGIHQLPLEKENISAGVYLLQLKNKNELIIQKLIIE